MSCRIDNVGSFHELFEQEAVYSTIASGVPAHDVSLWIESVRVNTAAARDLHRHIAAVVDEGTVAGTVVRAVSADHSPLRVNAAQKRAGGTRAIDGLIDTAREHESVQSGVAYITSHNSASGDYGWKRAVCAGKIDSGEIAST